MPSFPSNTEGLKRARLSIPSILRTPLRKLSLRRLLSGGRVTDLGRLPRYIGVFLISAAGIWAPITGYLKTAPLRFTSSMSLILPGSGASASVNLSEIGQASSYANSAFASSSVSPTVTYKRLIGADRIVARAAEGMQMHRRDFGNPRVELIDQTGLIRIQITGNSAEDAQARGDALLSAFFAELDALRADELDVRETSGSSAMEEYRNSVAATRVEIEALQRETGLISAAQYAQIVAGTDALRGRLNDMRVDLSEQTQRVAALQRALNISPSMAASTLKLHADSEFSALTQEMAVQAAAFAEAEGRFGRNHPTVTEARTRYQAAQRRAFERAAGITGLPAAQIATLDLSPTGERAALLSTLVETEALRLGLKAQCDALEAQVELDEARVAALLLPAARLEDLQRDFQVAEAVFASAMARSETKKSDLYASYPLVQVLENPSFPESPSSPRKKLAIAAGGAATFLLLMGLALGWLRRPLINSLLTKKAKS